MTRRYKIAAIVIAIITMSISTFAGVLASSKLSSISFVDNELKYESIDEVDGNVGMVNVLFIGVDEGGYRSDTIMFVSLDDYSSRVSILSIPRDTMVKINGSTQKINATMGFASINSTPTFVPDKKANEPTPEPTPKLSQAELDELPSKLSTTSGHEDALISKVKNLTGLPVHYFVTVDFDGFMDVIEAVDGVEFNVPYNMDYDDPVQGLHIHLKAGQQHLTGQLAHDFVRFRHNNDGSAPGEYVMGDEGRMYWQQQFIKELVKQKLNPQYISKIDDVYEVFKNNVRTNLEITDIIKNLNALMKVNLEDISSYQLPGEFDYINDIWYFVHSEKKTQTLINDVFRPQSREEWDRYLAEQQTGTAEPTATASN